MDGGTKKSPSDFNCVDVNWVASEIGFPFPVWVEKELYNKEFHSTKDKEIASHLIDALSGLGVAIDKLFAASDGPNEVVIFKYWRKLSERATKMKPTQLKASLYQNPSYGNAWMLLEWAQ